MYVPRKKYTRRPRRRLVRRRVYKPRVVKSRMSLHGPKKFVATFKLQNVIASPFGTHPDGYTRNLLSVSLGDSPIFSNLYTLYQQFAITSVKLMYRPTINAATSGLADIAAAQILYSENKDAETPISPLQIRSEDNCRNYVSTRGWSTFVKKPRPALYQFDALENPIKVITKANDIHWLSPKGVEDPVIQLKHLIGQMCVSDVTGATGDVNVGELWCKCYFAVKEQRKVAGV